jgi:hypothetical protein
MFARDGGFHREFPRIGVEDKAMKPLDNKTDPTEEIVTAPIIDLEVEELEAREAPALYTMAAHLYGGYGYYNTTNYASGITVNHNETMLRDPQ